jgi:hypothetical protein
MITNDNAKTYNISANISPIDIELCKVYIRGAVNAICNYSENAEFSVRILFGGITGIGIKPRYKKYMIITILSTEKTAKQQLKVRQKMWECS